jgi:hypothetical protein
VVKGNLDIEILTPKEAKMPRQKHQWFVWPKDSHTNEAFARFMDSGDFGFQNDILLKGALCSDKQRRNLWETTEQDAWFLWRSRIDLKFEIFNRLGENGQIRNVTFLFKKDRRSPKKTKHTRRAHAG